MRNIPASNSDVQYRRLSVNVDTILIHYIVTHYKVPSYKIKKKKIHSPFRYPPNFTPVD